MFLDYLYKKCGFYSYKKVLLFDFDRIIIDDYLPLLKNKFGYTIVHYEDIEEFRYLFEKNIKTSEEGYLIIVRSDIYIPFDVREKLYCVDLSYSLLFPRLNSYVLENSSIFDLDLLYIAHENLYRNIDSEAGTKAFIFDEMYSKENIDEYVTYLSTEINRLIMDANHISWRKAAILFAKYEFIKYKTNLMGNDKEFIDHIDDRFREYIIKYYSSLSGLPASNGPVLLNRGLDYISMNSKKFALIVMDGMSIQDWLIISEGLEGIKYKFNSTFAIIPTITSLSRQSLLSGKFPVEMERPFSMVNEKNMFTQKCIENGYKSKEIRYFRGYDFDIEYTDKCITVIINDIDDLVHSQRQGNVGMFNDVKLLSNSRKLLGLIYKLQNNGFDIYITSDHGHKETVTIGNPKGTGVEIETKSKRTIILKDFADYEKITEEYGMIEYEPYFLPKDFKYLLCEHNVSFGFKGDTVISHGGISIEEVIVPFIKIEGVNK